MKPAKLAIKKNVDMVAHGIMRLLSWLAAYGLNGTENILPRASSRGVRTPNRAYTWHTLCRICVGIKPEHRAHEGTQVGVLLIILSSKSRWPGEKEHGTLHAVKPPHFAQDRTVAS